MKKWKILGASQKEQPIIIDYKSNGLSLVLNDVYAEFQMQLLQTYLPSSETFLSFDMLLFIVALGKHLVFFPFSHGVNLRPNNYNDKYSEYVSKIT